MFVVNATPLRKGFGLEVLSYFSSEAVLPGSIISVPLRKGVVKALVLESVLAKDVKAEIRSADFSLRKMERINSEPFLSSVWMKSVKDIAEFSAVSYRSTLTTFLPSFVMKNLELIVSKKSSSKKALESLRSSDVANSVRLSSENSFWAFQGSDEERISHYKGIIREEFAKKRSVFICLSRNEDIETAKEIFEKGIEKYVTVWTPTISKKKFSEQLKKITEEKHPLLIIGSPQWLFLSTFLMSDMGKVGTIILDGEQDGSWKTFNKPFIDLKRFVEIFAKNSGIKLILGDSVLSLETVWKYKKYDPYKFETLNFRASLSARSHIIDMNRKVDIGAINLLLSSELLDLIRNAKEKGKNVFIFSARKGLSSMTVCRDCGEGVFCNNCGSPVVLYKGKEMNIFRCHQCGEMRNAEEVCKKCGSWRLLPLGVGVERVKEELEKAISGLHIFEINKEVTPTSAKAKQVYTEFQNTIGGVLIGTEMALNFFEDNVDIAIIASVDSLFAIPDYHIREKIFHLILKIASVANEEFLIQTRHAEKETVNMALGGNILDFYKREIKEREEMNYPPFSIFIKITCRGQKPFVKTEMTKIAKIFKLYSPAIFPSTSEKQGSPYAENAVIKIKKEEWPQEKLLNLLRTLPPFFEIKVDPDNLL